MREYFYLHISMHYLSSICSPRSFMFCIISSFGVILALNFKKPNLLRAEKIGGIEIRRCRKLRFYGL